MPTKTTIIIRIVVFYYVVLLALFIYIFIHKALKLSGLAYVLLTTKKGEDNEGAPSNIHYTTLHYSNTHTPATINEKEQAGRRRRRRGREEN